MTIKIRVYRRVHQARLDRKLERVRASSRDRLLALSFELAEKAYRDHPSSALLKKMYETHPKNNE